MNYRQPTGSTTVRDVIKYGLTDLVPNSHLGAEDFSVHTPEILSVKGVSKKRKMKIQGLPILLIFHTEDPLFNPKLKRKILMFKICNINI